MIMRPLSNRILNSHRRPGEPGRLRLERNSNEENIPTLPEKEEEDSRFLCPEGDPRRPPRDQRSPEKGSEEIGRQLRR